MRAPCSPVPWPNSPTANAIGRSTLAARLRRCFAAVPSSQAGATAPTIGGWHAAVAIGAIVAAMLTPLERRNLLRIEQSRDAVTIASAIKTVLVDNPAVDLLEIEMPFREAASSAFLVADDDGFYVVIGIRNWSAELNRLGRTPEQNRALLARD